MKTVTVTNDLDGVMSLLWSIAQANPFTAFGLAVFALMALSWKAKDWI